MGKGGTFLSGIWALIWHTNNNSTKKLLMEQTPSEEEFGVVLP